MKAKGWNALGAFESPSLVGVVLAQYASFDGPTRQHAISILASRRSWALSLVRAAQKGSIARGDFTAYSVRQLAAFGDRKIDRVIHEMNRLGSVGHIANPPPIAGSGSTWLQRRSIS